MFALLTLTLSGLLSAACSSSEGDDAPAGCTNDQACKGDRICVDGACVAPDDEGAAGQSTGSGSAGTSSGGSGPVSTEPKPCTLTSNDCDADCQANCGTPSCVELCCTERTSPGVLCKGTCQAVGTIECKGACVAGTTNTNCGSCGNACDEANGEECRDGECKLPTCEELGTDCPRCVKRPDCGFCRSKKGAMDECRPGDASGPTDGSSCPGNWPEDLQDGGWIREYNSCPV